MDKGGISTRSGAVTSIGRVREHNEDAWLADEKLGLWVVADGMGGHEAGEVASKLACAAIRKAVADGNALVDAIKSVQKALAVAIERGEGSEDMGTTVVALKADSSRYQLAWVGDSRAYLWHDGQLRQLTHDHSFVQELIDNQAISAEEAEVHPERSTLSRCLGGGLDEDVEIDEISGRFFAGERIILCTDGISGEITEAELQACLRAHSEATSHGIASALVECALDAGGNDNATALVVAAPRDAPDRLRQTAPRRRVDFDVSKSRHSGRRRVVASAVGIILLVTLVASAWFFLHREEATARPQPAPQSFAESGIEQMFTFAVHSSTNTVRGD